MCSHLPSCFSLYPPLLRFFAHFVIYLRLLHQDPPLEPANVILQAYLDVLEEEGKSELVAVYAASLGEQNGAESYARFLKGQSAMYALRVTNVSRLTCILPSPAAMDPRATKEERRVALLRAKEHGLDLVEVAKLTVNMVMNETFMVSPTRAWTLTHNYWILTCYLPSFRSCPACLTRNLT